MSTQSNGQSQQNSEADQVELSLSARGNLIFDFMSDYDISYARAKFYLIEAGWDYDKAFDLFSDETFTWNGGNSKKL